MKHKMHLFCLAFNSLSLVKSAIETTEETLDGAVPASKTIVDCHYPLEPNPLNTQMLAHLAKVKGWNFVRPARNRSVAGNWNWIIRELELGEGDVAWGCDPDGRPQQAGWMQAALEVFDNSPECYYVGFNRKEIYDMKHLGAMERKIGNTWILDYPQLISWSLGGFSIPWLNKIGGFLQDSAQYGYCEHAISRKANPLGGKFYMLRDFYDNHLGAEHELYTEWKISSANKTTDKEFSIWLKEKQNE